MSRKSEMKAQAHRAKMDKKHKRNRDLKALAVEYIQRLKAASEELKATASDVTVTIFAKRPSRTSVAAMLSATEAAEVMVAQKRAADAAKKQAEEAAKAAAQNTTKAA